MTYQVENDRGEWVPVIPRPVFYGFRMNKCRCKCERTFKTYQRYKEHYAYAHILGMDEKKHERR